MSVSLEKALSDPRAQVALGLQSAAFSASADFATSQQGHLAEEALPEDGLLQALRDAGILDILVVAPVEPAVNKLWLDTTGDSRALKIWDNSELAWVPATFELLFRSGAGKVVVDELRVASTSENVLTVDQPVRLEPGQLFSIAPEFNNTGSVLMNVTGIGSYPLMYIGGAHIAPNELTAGTVKVLLFEGSQFYVLMPTADAQNAAVEARYARDVAIEAAANAVAQGFVPIFDNPASAASFNLQHFTTLTVNRSAALRTIKPHRYSKVAQPSNIEPTVGPKFQSADGKWWALDEICVRPEFFGVAGGLDETVAVQAAVDYACMLGKEVNLQGKWNVKFVTFGAGSAFFQVSGNAEMKGIDTVARRQIVGFTRSNFSMTGSIAADGQYSGLYSYGFGVYNPSQLQAVIFDKLIAAGCAAGMAVGHPDYPSAIISENTFDGFRTYGCPQVLHIIGAQTYGMVNNPPAMSADAFGGDAAWAARPKRALVGFGANVSLSIGEVLQVTSPSASDYVYEMQPILAGTELSWGRMKLLGPFTETAGPLLLINNPLGLTGLNTAKDRGRVVLSYLDGFVASDVGPFIAVASGAGFTGDIILDFPNFWHPGTRAFPNVDCGNNACHVYCRGGNFGGGFLPMLAGVVGGILHYEHQIILQGFGLPATALAVGNNLLKFQSTVAGGNLARWQSMYNSGNGQVTIPLGGKDAIRFENFIHVPSATGQLIIKRNGLQVQASQIGTGDFTLVYSEKDPPAGTIYTFELVISSFAGGTPTAPATNAGANTFVLWASR